MCNLYRMTKNASEVAAWFDAVEGAGGANFAAEVYPGYSGLVVAEGAVRAMTWGFPFPITRTNGDVIRIKPVNNARSDKLRTGFWQSSFVRRRCLIPLSAWAEAQGERGRMTRTWLSLPGADLAAAAGVWRPTAEWGDCYAMVMTDSAGCDASAVHERMPVLLAPADHARWLAAPPEEALALCRRWDRPLAIDPTFEPWSKRAAGAQLGLF